MIQKLEKQYPLINFYCALEKLQPIVINLEILCLKYCTIQKKFHAICLLKCLVIIQKKKKLC